MWHCMIVNHIIYSTMKQLLGRICTIELTKGMRMIPFCECSMVGSKGEIRNETYQKSCHKSSNGAVRVLQCFVSGNGVEKILHPQICKQNSSNTDVEAVHHYWFNLILQVWSVAERLNQGWKVRIEQQQSRYRSNTPLWA